MYIENLNQTPVDSKASAVVFHRYPVLKRSRFFSLRPTPAWPAFLISLALAFTAYSQSAGPTQALEQQMELPDSVVAIPARAASSLRAIPQDRMNDTLVFEVALRMRNFEELQARIAEGNPASDAEMESDYRPLPGDCLALKRWLESNGFGIVQTDPGRLAIFARGTLKQIEQSFGVNMVDVTLDGQAYHTANGNPKLPVSIGAPVLGINGLQPFLKAAKHAIRKSSLANNAPPYTVGQILGAYNGAGLAVTGSGQTIAILIDAVANSSDLVSFWNANAVPQSLGNIETVAPCASIGLLPAGPSGEETLDEEWSSGIASGAKIRVYATGDLEFSSLDMGLVAIINDLASHPQMHQLSISLAAGETDLLPGSQMKTDSQYFAALANNGVSVFAASGDWGSNFNQLLSPLEYNPRAPLQISYYSSDPSITGVGGTSLVLGSSNQVTGEVAWFGPCSTSQGILLLGSGGGVSRYFHRPSWQVAPGVLAGAMRVVPDVGLVADPNTGGFVVLDGAVYQFGGTSWSTPTWAGFCALINQARADASLPPIGLLNRVLYPIHNTGSFLRGITSGSNGHYKAGPGYNAVTGLGVPNVATLIQTLSTDPLVFNLTPANGLPLTTVTINGVNFSNATSVTFNGVPVPFFDIISDSVITAIVPFNSAASPLAKTSGSVCVITPAGTSKAADFTLSPVNTALAANTLPATETTGYSAVLNGVINPDGHSTLNYFEYGKTVAYGQSSVASGSVSASGTIPFQVSASISQLSGSTTYHFRIVTKQNGVLKYGKDLSFKTSSGVPPPTLITNGASHDQSANPYFETVCQVPVGGAPVGFVLGNDRNLYGTTASGGIFKISTSGAFTPLANYKTGIGGPLALGADGNFYGTGADGSFFRITPDGAVSILANSIGTTATLTTGTDGNFYVPAPSGGIFQITPAGIVKTIASLGQAGPDGPLASGTDGSFYGATSHGGTGYGSLFKVTPGGKLTTIASLSKVSALAMGCSPIVGLALGQDGNFYGTLQTQIYSLPYFSAFKVTPEGKLTSLTGMNGYTISQPTNQALVMGHDGNFYGTSSGAYPTSLNGTSSVFMFTPTGSFGPVWFFTGGADGIGSSCALVAGADGNLYGGNSTVIFRVVLPPPSDSWTVAGTVDPNGFETSVYAQYGTTTQYGYTTTPMDAGNGTSAINYSASIDVEGGTTYHYRLVAVSNAWAAYGTDHTFTSDPTPPAALTGMANGTTSQTTTLNGTVDPSGLKTVAYFNFGPTAAYGMVSARTNLGDKAGVAPVTARLTGLTAGTTYHFQVVAVNLLGTSFGEDQVFTTTP